jgi:RHS repeat-associated protein
VTSTYNAQGQRVAVTSTLGAQVSYERDAFGQVRQMHAPGWQAQFERDAQGLEMQRQLSGGVLMSWQRDAFGRPQQQRLSAGRGVARTERRRHYDWGEDAQLSQFQDSVTGLIDFTHDALGQLTATRFASGEEQLRWPDVVGNLFGTRQRDDRRYGPAGQLLQAKGTQYRYDGLGQLVSKLTAQGAEWTYAWNGAGQLAEVVRPDGQVVRFAYDALGRRVRKTFRGRVTRWVWDGYVPLHEWQELAVGPGVGSVDDLTTWLFEDASFVPAAKLTAQGAQSVFCDHLGTPLALYDGQGHQTWEVELDSYGAVRRGRGQAQDCPFRYQGQYEDIETGLYYNRFRYYDPQSGQYISQDPIGLLGGSLLHGYVNDPTSEVDVFGLSSYALGKSMMKASNTHGGLVTQATKATEWQAHHLIPEEVWGNVDNTKFFKSIKLRGRDSATNGIFLPNSQALGDHYGFDRYHLGSHANYSTRVEAEMSIIRGRLSANPSPADIAQARQDVRSLQQKLFHELNQRTNGTGCRRLG